LKKKRLSKKEMLKRLDAAIANFNSPEVVAAAKARERRVHRYSAKDSQRRFTI